MAVGLVSKHARADLTKSQFHKTRINFSKSIIYGIEISQISLSMSIQSWKWRNIDSIFQFIIFSGNYCSRSSQNALQWVNCRDWTRFPDPLWRHPSYGQVGSPSNPELYGNSRWISGRHNSFFACFPGLEPWTVVWYVWLKTCQSFMVWNNTFNKVLIWITNISLHLTLCFKVGSFINFDDMGALLKNSS
jgi:hypothetical protein